MADHKTQPGAEPEVLGDGAEALLKTLRLGFFFLRAIILVLLASYIFSGFFIVKTNEEAFLLRFGSLVGDSRSEQVIERGLAWGWPRPIDRVVRIPVKEPKTVTSTHFWFRETPVSAITKPGNTPVSATETLAPGMGGYLLTGDANIVHARWSLVYRVSDPVAYHSNYVAPEEVIRRLLETSILREVSSSTIDQMLYDPAALRQKVKDRANARINALRETADLGVEVDDIYYIDRTPPRAVLKAFKEVTEAEQEKDRLIGMAAAYKVGQQAEGAQRASRILAEANAWQHGHVDSIKSDADYFAKIKTEYDKAGVAVLLARYVDTIYQVLDQVDAVYIVHGTAGEGNLEVRLNLSPEKKKRTFREPPPVHEEPEH